MSAPAAVQVVVAPTNPFDRGVVLAHQGQYALAASEFMEAGKQKNDGRAFGCGAYCLTVRKEHKFAAAIADLAVRHGYRTAPVYAHRAYNHLQVSQLKEAKADCDEALRLDPHLRPAHLTRAAIHLQLSLANHTRLPREAVADIDLVTAGAANTAEVWFLAALIYARAPDQSPAMRDKAAHAVREAVRAGKPPGSVARNKILRAALAGHPVYEEALKLKPGPVVLAGDPHLIDIIP